MFDVQGPLITAGLVSIVGAIVQIYSILQDRRHSQSSDERKKDKEPLVKRAMDLSNLDQYTVIQQRMIDALTEDDKKKDARIEALLAENKTLRDQMIDMFIQIRGMERRTSSYDPPHSDDEPT